jgi:hypothetical protein
MIFLSLIELKCATVRVFIVNKQSAREMTALFARLSNQFLFINILTRLAVATRFLGGEIDLLTASINHFSLELIQSQWPRSSRLIYSLLPER